MRFLFIIAFASTAVIPFVPDTPITIVHDFTYIEVPPLSYFGSVQIKVKGYFGSFKYRCCKVEIFNYIYPSGKEIYSYELESPSLDFVFQFNNAYTTEDIYFRFTETVSKTSVIIYPKFSQAPTVIISDNSTFQYENVGVYTHELGSHYENETYLFHGFESIYVPDYYHKLDISTLSIKTATSKTDTFKYNSAFFYVYDPENLFDEFSQYKTGEYLIIPLSFTNNEDGSHSLKFANAVYVNPITLKMSLVNKTGYVKTRHLYFPINKKGSEESFRFGLTVTDLGANLMYLTHSFTVKTYKNIIGDCSNAEYCVSVTSSNKGDSN